MNVDEIPQELINLLDERAGKKHSRDGIVLTTLAELLTLYDELMENPISYQVRTLNGNIRNIALVGHPDSGKTELRNDVLEVDETPITPIIDEIIIFE